MQKPGSYQCMYRKLLRDSRHFDCKMHRFLHTCCCPHSLSNLSNHVHLWWKHNIVLQVRITLSDLKNLYSKESCNKNGRRRVLHKPTKRKQNTPSSSNWFCNVVPQVPMSDLSYPWDCRENKSTKHIITVIQTQVASTALNENLWSYALLEPGSFSMVTIVIFIMNRSEYLPWLPNHIISSQHLRTCNYLQQPYSLCCYKDTIK